MSNAFPQLRKDPIVERWVLIAPERAARPGAYHPSHRLPDVPHECPFCEGQEERTPAEIQAVRDPITPANGPGWQVRVVPNRFPAVREELSGVSGGDDLFHVQAGIGAHELVIECPEHQTSLTTFSDRQIVDVFSLYCDRMAVRRAEGKFAYTQLFKNHGMGAGASVPHAHAQIVSLPVVPSSIRAEVSAAMAYHSRTTRCLFCDFLHRELADNVRVAHTTSTMVAITAYAGRFPYETWILPKHHERHFDCLTDRELTDLATTVRWLVGRLEELADFPPYNLVLHTAPFHEAVDYHWHFELLPRLTGVAGLEWGAGVYVNPVPPEDAATRLRGH